MSPPRRPSPDVVVVGGGVVGASAAAFLAEAGARVTLVERDGLASGASGANSGLVQHPTDPVLAALYRETLERYRALEAAEAGFRLGRRPTGMLFLSTDEAAVRAQAAAVTTAFPDLVADILSGAALEAADPAVGRGLWASRVDIGYAVRPASGTYAYATLAERLGVRLRVGRAASLDVRGDRVAGITLDGESLPAAAVLAAAGPGTAGLLDPGGRWRPIRPQWGVVVEVALPEGPRHALEEAEIDASIGVPATGDSGPGEARSADRADFSLIPLEGLASVGSTFLAEEPEPSAWVERILARAASFVPSVLDAPIRGVRTCARPRSADGRPLVGPVPGLDGAWVCAGHGPWGISTGPASARLVADAILGRSPAIPTALDPARFGPPRG